MATEAQKKAVRKYNAVNVKAFTFKLNKKTDKDILEHMNEISNKQGYLKSLVRADIEGRVSTYVNSNENLQQP